MDVFRTYHPVLSRLIAALANVLQTCRFITASASPSRAELHLRLLLLAAEQLARERGFLAGRLCGKQPESLSSPLGTSSETWLALAEIIGARKVLTGGAFFESQLAADSVDLAQGETETHVVAAASGGLPVTLQLADSSLLESADLWALARAEQQVLSRCNGVVDQAAVSELYYLLLELADKVHQLILIRLMELFSPPRHI